MRLPALIDTLNLAERIKCPVLMGNGLFDDDCPPHIGFAVYNRLTTRKEYRIYPDESHLLGAAWNRDAHAWLRREFGLPPLAPSPIFVTPRAGLFPGQRTLSVDLEKVAQHTDYGL